MPNFIGGTVGLMVTHDRFKTPLLVRCEYNRRPDRSVTIAAVSGHSLGDIKAMGKTVVSSEEFENRPFDPYDSITEARWALNKLGASIAGEA